MTKSVNEVILEQAKALCAILEENAADDITLLHVGDRTVIADYFIICSGKTPSHVKSLCDHLEEHLAELKLTILRNDGYEQGRWIVCDLGSILVHIFHPEERVYYNMERLWRDESLSSGEMKD
ncbi:MAG: ribosome silencing factor [Clostridiales bacterium]|nr:ribosome silencing factor [Clostridiales bacterium]